MDITREEANNVVRGYAAAAAAAFDDNTSAASLVSDNRDVYMGGFRLTTLSRRVMWAKRSLKRGLKFS